MLNDKHTPHWFLYWLVVGVTLSPFYSQIFNIQDSITFLLHYGTCWIIVNLLPFIISS